MGKLRKAIDSLRIWATRHWMWLAIAAVIVIWVFTPLIVPIVVGIAQSCLGSDLFQGAGQFGDQFGATNALFTAMTVLLVFIAFWAERNDRKEAEKRWRRERAEVVDDRKQAEERWNVERAEMQRKQQADERDRHVSLFFEALSRYVAARDRAHLIMVNVKKGDPNPIRSQELSGWKVVSHCHGLMGKALREEPKEYLDEEAPEARQTFENRVRDAYEQKVKSHLGPMVAHLATMNWAIDVVERTDQRAISMLTEAARGTITKQEFDLLVTLAMIDSETRKFVRSVYDLQECSAPFAMHQLEWING